MDSLNDSSPICQISTETLRKNNKDSKDIIWTCNVEKELPIFLSKNDSIPPVTIMEMFESSIKDNLKEEALFIERDGKWISWTWNHYSKEVQYFAKALILSGIAPYKSVNILGVNSPEWYTAFIGGIYACVIPSGIYNTNNEETCVYICEHSDCACIVLDNIEQFKKYEKHFQKLKSLKIIIFYGDIKEEILKGLVNPYVKIYLWKEFIDLGKNANNDNDYNSRIRMQKPGNCCNIVYTSGTTGQPKAVLLSHDNMTWMATIMRNTYGHITGDRNRIISYLPLSHIAGQVNDLMRKTIILI